MFKAKVATRLASALLTVAVIASLGVNTVSAYPSSVPERFTDPIPTTSSSVSQYAPQNLRTTIKSRYSVKLSWDDATPYGDGTAADIRYYVYRAYFDNEGVYRAFRLAPTLQDKNSYTLTGLESNLTNRYFVRAAHKKSSKWYNSRLVKVDTSGMKRQLNIDSSLDDEDDPTLPGKISASLSDSNYTMTFRWKASADSDSGMLGYRFYRMRNYNSYLVGEVKTDTTGYVTYKVQGIEKSPKHAFYVVAVDEAGNTSGGALAVQYFSNN